MDGEGQRCTEESALPGRCGSSPRLVSLLTLPNKTQQAGGLNNRAVSSRSQGARRSSWQVCVLEPRSLACGQQGPPCVCTRAALGVSVSSVTPARTPPCWSRSHHTAHFPNDLQAQPLSEDLGPGRQLTNLTPGHSSTHNGATSCPLTLTGWYILVQPLAASTHVLLPEGLLRSWLCPCRPS